MLGWRGALTPAYSAPRRERLRHARRRHTDPVEDALLHELLERSTGHVGGESVRVARVRRQNDMSKEYRFDGSDEVLFEVVSPAPAGAISATAIDMDRFMLAQLGDSEQPLPDPETRALMHQSALTEDSIGCLAAGPVMTAGILGTRPSLGRSSSSRAST